MMDSEFHVARIIDEYNIIINGGSDDGLVKGAKFDVVRKTKTPLVDQATGKTLAMIQAKDIRVVAIEVEPTYSICSSERIVYGGLSTYLDQVSRSMLSLASAIPTALESRHDPLPVDPLDMQGYPEAEVPIKVGDVVKLVSLPAEQEPESVESGEQAPDV